MASIPVPAISHQPPPDEYDTFPWFGAVIRIAPTFGELVWQDWVEEFGYLDADDPASLTSGKELFRRMIHEPDFEEFWALAVKHRQGNADMQRVMQAVLAGLAGRPTEGSGESSPGPEKSEAESTVAFLRRASAGRPEIEAGLIETALDRGALTG